MTLKEKICEPFGGLRTETANELEKITDDFAIEFAEWAIAKNMGVSKFTLYKGELEIFKKEKGL